LFPMKDRFSQRQKSLWSFILLDLTLNEAYLKAEA
jgi:hypothetical protein